MTSTNARHTEPDAIYPRELREVSEDTLQQLFDFGRASLFRLRRGKYAYRYAFVVADEWAREGRSILTGKRIEREQGCCRRTAYGTIRQLIEEGIIREIGRTEDGRPMYEPCLEIGDDLRARAEVRNAA